MNYIIEKFIKDLNKDIKENDQEQATLLSNAGGITTSWNAYHNKTNPGFFTPFNQQLSNQKIAGIKQAAIAASYLPIMQLTVATIHALIAAFELSCSLKHVVYGEWDEAATKIIDTAVEITAAIYYSAAFALTLLTEVTALLTRSIATLVDMTRKDSVDNVGPLHVRVPQFEDDVNVFEVDTYNNSYI